MGVGCPDYIANLCDDRAEVRRRHGGPSDLSPARGIRAKEREESPGGYAAFQTFRRNAASARAHSSRCGGIASA